MTQPSTRYDVPKGTVLMSTQQILQSAFSFIFYVAIARILTQAEIGQIALFAFILTTFNTTTQLSLPSAATRFIAERIGANKNQEAAAVAHTTLKLLLLISAPSLVIGYAASPILSNTIFGQTELSNLLIITLTTAFILDITTIYGAQLLGLGLYSSFVIQHLIYFPLSRILALTLAYTNLKVLGIVTGWLIASLIMLAASLIMIKGKFGKASTFPPRTLLSYSLPLLGFNLIGIFQNWADITLLYAFTSNLSATGIYYIVASSAGVLGILWGPLINAIFPAISSRYGKEGSTGIQDTLSASIRVINISIIPLSMSAAVISPLLIQITFGESYANGAIPFSILVATLILQAYAALILLAMQAIAKTKPILLIGTASVAIEIVALAAMANPLGATGAAIARTLLFTTNIILGHLVLRRIIQLKFTEALSKSLAVTIATAIPLGITDFYLAQYLSAALATRAIIAALLFTLLFTATTRRIRLLNDSDFNLLKQAFPKPLHRLIDFAKSLLIPSPRSPPS